MLTLLCPLKKGWTKTIYGLTHSLVLAGQPSAHCDASNHAAANAGRGAFWISPWGGGVPRFESLIKKSYFVCVQLAIGGRGHVTQHMRESTLHNQNKNNFREIYRAVQIAVGGGGRVQFKGVGEQNRNVMYLS